ncbi:ninjurin-2-like [Lytechinus pictus]|uniref:ninjurin-2-like n=1 Tax=Lytechinus pictus TaxID=7653 RepID=UPI00240D31B0|nr:ninjurin-2-like [Lytechinus pictus]
MANPATYRAARSRSSSPPITKRHTYTTMRLDSLCCGGRPPRRYPPFETRPTVSMEELEMQLANMENPPPPPIDFNLYATKKTIAEGFLVVALLAANAAQLKTIITAGKENQFHGFVTALVILSIVLLIIVIVFLLLLGRDNLNDVYKQRKLDWINNFATALVFCIVFMNIFVCAFGIEHAPL